VSKSDGLTLVPEASALETWVTDYLDEKRAAGCSRKTLAVYTDLLREVLLPFCRRAELTEPAELTARQLNALSAGLLDGSGTRSGRPLAKASVASYARTINAFLAWLAKQGEAPGAHMQKPKLPERVVETLSREDIRALEDAASTERDKLIIRILADTGVRLDELLRLKADSVRLEPGRKWYRSCPAWPTGSTATPSEPARTPPATCSSWAAGGAPGQASTSRSPSRGPSR
jgi:integrase